MTIDNDSFIQLVWLLAIWIKGRKTNIKDKRNKTVHLNIRWDI